jgi:choline dehydrogenase-like flavoprotein
VQARAAFYDARMRHLFANDRANPYVTPPDAPFVWIRAHQAGGRTHTFGRVLLRWTDDDFKGHSRTGKGVDWPIDYADLVPFYEEVERSLGIYGQVDDVPTLPDSVYAHRAELTPAETVFKQHLEAKWPERKAVTWRYIGPEPTRVLKPLRDALGSGNLDIRYNTVARRVLTDKSGKRAIGVEAFDTRTREVQMLRARSVVLCASPVESIRLLLNSAAPDHPAGLGNSSGTLGAYFMDQLPCVAAGTFPPTSGWAAADSAPSDPFYGPSGGVYVPRFIDKDGKSAANEFAYQGSIGRRPSPTDRPSRHSWFGYGAMLPDANNRITLDKRRKDAWGMPIPRIVCKMGASDEQTLRRELDALAEMIEGTGGELEFIGSPLGLVEKGRGAYPDADPVSRLAFRALFKKTMVMGAAIHEAGGARMGEESSRSVLNRWNQVWDVPNLLVTDASAFASSGVSGTTLTIMAMTIRACRNLAGDLKAGRT